jgi:hypothetical protein
VGVILAAETLMDRIIVALLEQETVMAAQHVDHHATLANIYQLLAQEYFFVIVLFALIVSLRVQVGNS